MPKMNGFELYQEIEKVDKKAKVCFITAFEVYYQALKEIFPTLDVGCFIRKPIEIDDLVRRINTNVKKCVLISTINKIKKLVLGIETEFVISCGCYDEYYDGYS